MDHANRQKEDNQKLSLNPICRPKGNAVLGQCMARQLQLIFHDEFRNN